MTGRGSDTIHFDLEYQGMEQTYFISKFLLWNCKTLKNYAIKKKKKESFVLQITQTWLQSGNLYAKKIYWQLSEGISRRRLLSKGRRARSWGRQRARQGSTLIGKGTGPWYPPKLSRASPRMVTKFSWRPVTSREVHGDEAGRRPARKPRCSKTHGQAQAQLQHCSGRSQQWEPELKGITQVKGTGAYLGFGNFLLRQLTNSRSYRRHGKFGLGAKTAGHRRRGCLLPWLVWSRIR